MKWLEIIELRSVSKPHALVEQDLADLTAGADQESKPRAIDVYRNLTVETDWGIHLHYESERQDICQSPLGLCLAAALKEFGLVHHSVWIEGK